MNGITQPEISGNGEFRKRRRRMDPPAFHRCQFAGFVGKMTDATERMLRGLQTHPAKYAGIDISSEMARLTYSIVGRTLFSFDTEEDMEVVEQAMRVMLPHVFNRLGRIVQVPDWIPTPANWRFRRALTEVDRVVYKIIARHREAEEEENPENDLLAMLMRARH